MLIPYYLPYLIWNVVGITLGTRKSPSQARIINGKSVSGAKFPFLAQVYQKVNDGKTEQWYRTVGSIVTNSVILTCGHCVCDDSRNSKFVTCQPDVKLKKTNQNQKGMNEIYYSIGFQKFDRNTASYLSNIKVYLFRYDPPDDKTSFSKNGDIAAIKDDLGLKIIDYKATKISLPTSFGAETFGNEDGIDVKIAGRGARFKEFGSILSTSCTTNEGLAKSRLLPPNVQQIFLPCKYFYGPPPNRDACVSIRDDITSFHASTQVFIHNRAVQFHPQFSKDVCNDYWKKAIKHIETQETDYAYDGILTLDSFKSRADRIVVCGNDECYDAGTNNTDITKGEICYNAKKLGEFGVCTTYSRYYNWGFCSKSCGLPQSIPDEQLQGEQFPNYEILIAKYFDIAPPNSIRYVTGNFTITSTLNVITSLYFHLEIFPIFFTQKVVITYNFSQHYQKSNQSLNAYKQYLPKPRMQYLLRKVMGH